jgi:hypothetical protein
MKEVMSRAWSFQVYEEASGESEGGQVRGEEKSQISTMETFGEEEERWWIACWRGRSQSCN